MAHPTVIFIDWDQTLNFFRFWGHWKESRPAEYELVQTQLFGPANRPMIHNWMRGRLTAEQVIEWFSSQNGWSADELLSELRRSCELESFTDPVTAELIAELRRRGHPVVIATDNMDTFTRWTVPATKLTDHVDGILNSFELGILKADIAPDGSLPFFADFLAAHHLSPTDAVIIDDSHSLQPLAKAAGFQYQLVGDDRSASRYLETILNR